MPYIPALQIVCGPGTLAWMRVGALTTRVPARDSKKLPSLYQTGLAAPAVAMCALSDPSCTGLVRPGDIGTKGTCGAIESYNHQSPRHRKVTRGHPNRFRHSDLLNCWLYNPLHELHPDGPLQPGHTMGTHHLDASPSNAESMLTP